MQRPWLAVPRTASPCRARRFAPSLPSELKSDAQLSRSWCQQPGPRRLPERPRRAPSAARSRAQLVPQLPLAIVVLRQASQPDGPLRRGSLRSRNRRGSHPSLQPALSQPVDLGLMIRHRSNGRLRTAARRLRLDARLTDPSRQEKSASRQKNVQPNRLDDRFTPSCLFLTVPAHVEVPCHDTPTSGVHHEDRAMHGACTSGQRITEINSSHTYAQNVRGESLAKPAT